MGPQVAVDLQVGMVVWNMAARVETMEIAQSSLRGLMYQLGQSNNTLRA